MSLLKKATGSCIVAAAFFAAAPAFAQPPADVEVDEPDAYTDVTGSRIVVIGAINDPDAVETAIAEDESVPELPVVYEDAPGK